MTLPLSVALFHSLFTFQIREAKQKKRMRNTAYANYKHYNMSHDKFHIEQAEKEHLYKKQRIQRTVNGNEEREDSNNKYILIVELLTLIEYEEYENEIRHKIQSAIGFNSIFAITFGFPSFWLLSSFIITKCAFI